MLTNMENNPFVLFLVSFCIFKSLFAWELTVFRSMIGRNTQLKYATVSLFLVVVNVIYLFKVSNIQSINIIKNTTKSETLSYEKGIFVFAGVVIDVTFQM